MNFDWNQDEVPAGTSPYRDDLITVEFRSPRHTTYLMHAFWVGGRSVRVRFSPTEPGTWTYHVAGLIKRYNDQESTFTASDSGSAGFVSVANVRHWWTTNKQPHLWLAAAVPFLQLDQGAFESWLDRRKHDGFTHVRGTVLIANATTKPVSGDGQPNLAYFATLDDRILAALSRGFTLDLILADHAFVRSGLLGEFDKRDPLIRYIVSRYGGLNVTWQGIEKFESVPGSRELLRNIAESIKRYDSFRHPLSTDARDSSSPLIADGWMNYLIEGSASPQLGAVEHQFTQQPEIHVISRTAPDEFRHELWNCTTNAQYPSISYEALQNEANVKAVQTWFRVISDTRHWELEPYFDVDGARAVGLEEVEYLAYAEKPGIVEITLPKHKYNPVWVNPITGEELELKDYKGEVFSRQTPDSSHDWVLQVPREGHKASMLKSYRFESVDPPIQEPELDAAKTPFEIVEPSGDSINSAIPTPYAVKITRANRASRSMQYAWWGEVVAGGEGARLVGIGASGTFTIPKELLKQPGATMNLRLLAINANGKAYEMDRVYRLAP
ncbi:MAG: DUF5060 domain-containing protein [Acidobacteriaceae bacterium]|nr:DUF5060 domain-containing protein [Acidobacteriaceae bacterium]